MDEMKLKLSTNFMKKIVSKLLSRMIYSKTGYRVNIQINDLEFLSVNGDTTVKMNMEANVNSEEFNKIMKSIDLF